KKPGLPDRNRLAETGMPVGRVSLDPCPALVPVSRRFHLLAAALGFMDGEPAAGRRSFPGTSRGLAMVGRRHAVDPGHRRALLVGVPPPFRALEGQEARRSLRDRGRIRNRKRARHGAERRKNRGRKTVTWIS